jgi:hypothetical protein
LFLPDARELAAASRKGGRPRAQLELTADIPIFIGNDAHELRLGGLAQRGSRDEHMKGEGRHNGEQQCSPDSKARQVVGRMLRRASLASGFGHEILANEIWIIRKIMIEPSGKIGGSTMNTRRAAAGT